VQDSQCDDRGAAIVGNANATFGIVEGTGRSAKHMFRLSFVSNHRVLLAQFAGVLSSEDIKGSDKALVAFALATALHAGFLTSARFRQTPFLGHF